MTRACSAVASVCSKVLPGGRGSVCSKVLPGGRVRYPCVCDRSSGGRKPVGRKGTSENEPKKKTSAAMVVFTRCFRHHAAQPMYIVSQPGSVCSFFGERSRYAAIIGVSILATTSEKNTAMAAVQ